MEREARDAAGASGRGSVVEPGLKAVGAGLIALGVVGLGSLVAGVASMPFYGVLLLLAGVGQIVLGIAAARSERSAAPLLAGVLSAQVGLFLITHALAGLPAFALLLGLFYVSLGLFSGITSAVERRPGWRIEAGYSALTIALGAFVLVTWPESSAWLIGTLVSVELLARGATCVGVGALRT